MILRILWGLQISTDEWLSVLKGRFVEEEAFVRIAPAVSGVADRATVHNLFEALAGASDDQKGISLEVWLAYIQELVK